MIFLFENIYNAYICNNNLEERLILNLNWYSLLEH